MNDSATTDATDKMAAQVASRLTGAGSVLITSHANPDGDSIGSQLALARVLKPHVREITLANADPVPELYRWLPGSESILVTSRFTERQEIIVILECSDLDRSGIQGLNGDFLINLDHHEKNDFFGQLNWVSSSFSSVGEMIYHVAEKLGGGSRLPPAAAINLYTAILTDTGSFRFSNTNPDALRICGKLVEQGADPAEIAARLFENHSFSRIKLMGPVLSSLTMDPSGRMAWVVVRRKDMEQSGAREEDVEGIINLPRSIGQLEVVALFRETADGSFRVSLRSKRTVDVATVAGKFGGGGHLRAAGFSIDGPLDSAMEKTLSPLRRALAEEGAERSGGQ